MKKELKEKIIDLAGKLVEEYPGVDIFTNAPVRVIRGYQGYFVDAHVWIDQKSITPKEK